MESLDGAVGFGTAAAIWKWLADVFAQIAYHPVHRLHGLVPLNWARERKRRKLAA